MGTQVKPLDCAWAHKTPPQPVTPFYSLSLSSWTQDTVHPASEETGGIFEKIVAGVTGLEPATSCVTGRRSNQLSYTPGKGREKLAEVFWRSSGSAKKNDPDNRRQGGGCGEHRRRNVPLPESKDNLSSSPEFCQSSILPAIHNDSHVGKSQEKNKKWRRGRDSNPRYPCE